MPNTLLLLPSNSTKPRLYRRIRRRLRLFVSTRPWLYAYYAAIENLPFRLTDRTTVVVDSYPRSANSFFEAAFTRAHSGREEVAHHGHAAAQVMAGVRRGLPCVVLLRNPEDAVASFYEMNGGDYPISLCIKEYVSFYSALQPLIDDLIVVETSTLEERFYDLMVYLRDSHQLALHAYRIDESIRGLLFETVDATGRERNGFTRERYSEKLPPSEKAARRHRLDAIRALIREPRNARLFSRACNLYQRFSEHAFQPIEI